MERDYLTFVEEESLDLEEHIIATYEVEAEANSSLEEVSCTIARDPTIGTWAPVADVDYDDLLSQYSGKVLLPLPRGDVRSGRIRIALPLAVIDPALGGIPHLLALLGAPFGLKHIQTLRLANVQFPHAFTAAFLGPRFGLQGVYEKLGYPSSRPLLGTMLKPRSGLDCKAYAQLAFEALVSGVDIIFDDELMVSPQSAPLEERVPRIKEAALKASQQAGCRKLYAANVTSSLRSIVSTALSIKALGADILYFNPLSTGLSALEMLAADDEIGLPILCCRSMHGVFHRGQNGIDKYALLKFARLAGADGMHVGSIAGKLPHRLVGGGEEVRAHVLALTSKAKDLKPIIPILSGGMHPGNIEWNIKQTCPSVIIQAGSGVLGHPGGPRAGAKAMLDVVNGLTSGRNTLEVSRMSKELRRALEKWGYVDQGEVKDV